MKVRAGNRYVERPVRELLVEALGGAAALVRVLEGDAGRLGALMTAEEQKEHARAFDNILEELCLRFKHVHRAVRTQSLIVAALATMEAASVEDRKGVCLTEDEFLKFCRLTFQKARGIE